MLENVSVLYADDDPDILATLSNMAHDFGWTGDPASSASEVLDKVSKNCSDGGKCYDAIITAISFFSHGSEPGITGITAAKIIRKVRPNIPIIFITSHLNSIIREEVRRVDGSVLPKPIDPKLLFERVSQLIEWHRQAHDDSYTGEEKRRASINLSGHFRRSTDHALAVPERLEQIIKEASATNERR